MARFDLGDEEWAAIRRHLPKQGRGPQRRDDRTVLNGIFHILRTGAPWRDLPGRYGPPTTIYNRYVRWGERGIWQRILDALATECEDALIFIDSSIVKAQRAAAGSKGGVGARYWTLPRRSRQEGSRSRRPSRVALAD